MEEAGPGSTATEPSYDLEFVLEQADMRGAIDHTWTADPVAREHWAAHRRNLRQWTWIVSLLSMGLVIYVAIRIRRTVDHGDAVIPIMWCLLVAWLWWAILKGRRMTTAAFLEATKEKYVSDRGVQYCLGPHRLSVSRKQMVLRTTHFDTVQRWSGIDRVDVSDQLVMLVRPDARIFIVPKRALGSEAEFKAFAARCREWLAAHGGGDHQRIIHYLNGADLPCPRCKYNLRDCRSDQCPECALPLDRGSIPGAF